MWEESNYLVVGEAEAGRNVGGANSSDNIYIYILFSDEMIETCLKWSHQQQCLHVNKRDMI